MDRYCELPSGKPPREVVLLKGYPCIGSKGCKFCDYHLDNSTNTTELVKANSEVIPQITGKHGWVQLTNSGSVFEIPVTSLLEFKARCIKAWEEWAKTLVWNPILRVQVDARWEYREQVHLIRDFFKPLETKVFLGVETWNNVHRARLGKKWVIDPEEFQKYYDGAYVLIGLPWQTEEDVLKDLDLTSQVATYADINIYCNRTGAFPVLSDSPTFNWGKIRASIPLNFQVNEDPDDFGVGAKSEKPVP